MANGLLLSQNERILWASESTYDTDAVEAILTDGDTDIIYQQARNVEITTEGETVHVPRPRGSASGNKHGFIKGRCAVSMEVPLLPFVGTTEQVPHYDAVLKAAGFVPDLGTATESTYSPSTKQSDSMTLYKFYRSAETDNWRLQVVTGLRLTGTVTINTNGEAYLSLEGGGTYYSLSDPAEFFDPATGAIALLKDGLTAVTARVSGSEEIADQDPLVNINLTLTVDATERTMSALELDFAWTVTQVQATTGSATTVKHVLTRSNEDSRMSGSFSLADYTDTEINSLIDDFEAASEIAGSLVLGGVESGDDRITLTMPKMQIGIGSMSDSDGVYSFDWPFMLNGDWSDLAGDNELTIKYDQKA